LVALPDADAFEASEGYVAEESEAAAPLDAGAPGGFGFEDTEGLDLDATVCEAAEPGLEAELGGVDGGAVGA
jgi:hypothetical protein